MNLTVHPGDVLRDTHGLHTVHHIEQHDTCTVALVTEWTGQPPHPLTTDTYQVVYHHHRRSA